MSEAFARWNNPEECCLEQKSLGHDDKNAKTICDGIMERAKNGTLFKALPSLEILKAKDGELIVGGPASWELLDPEDDYVTTEGQVNFLKKFLQFSPEYRAITIDHTNFRIGTALLQYPEEKPTYFSHVHEKGMYLIAKIRNDNLKKVQQYRDLIKKGEYKMFSISGEPTRCDGPCDKTQRTEKIRKVYDIDPIEVAIVKEGMNPKANFEILKGKCPACIQHFKELYISKGFNGKVAEDMANKLYDHVAERLQKEDLQKPFANYTSWEDCVSQNSDKDDPEAYCATIKRQVEGKGQRVSYSKTELEKMTLDEIQEKLLTLYDERTIYEKILYPPIKVSESPNVTQESVPPQPVIPEELREKIRNELNLLNIQIYAIEDALKEKIKQVYKATIDHMRTTKDKNNLSIHDDMLKIFRKHFPDR